MKLERPRSRESKLNNNIENSKTRYRAVAKVVLIYCRRDKDRQRKTCKQARRIVGDKARNARPRNLRGAARKLYEGS